MPRRLNLVRLPPIPEPERPPRLDAFLAAHPEKRRVRALYEHFGGGALSRRGAKELLSAFVALLDERGAASRLVGGEPS